MPKKLPRFLDKNDPLEKEIERKVCAYAREQFGIENRKFASPQRRAAPDRIFFVPETLNNYARVFFIEFKKRGQKPTDAQAIEHVFYRKLGFCVFVVDNIDDGKSTIRLMAPP